MKRIILEEMAVYRIGSLFLVIFTAIIIFGCNQFYEVKMNVSIEGKNALDNINVNLYRLDFRSVKLLNNELTITPNGNLSDYQIKFFAEPVAKYFIEVFKGDGLFSGLTLYSTKDSVYVYQNCNELIFAETVEEWKALGAKKLLIKKTNNESLYENISLNKYLEASTVVNKGGVLFVNAKMPPGGFVRIFSKDKYGNIDNDTITESTFDKHLSGDLEEIKVFIHNSCGVFFEKDVNVVGL